MPHSVCPFWIGYFLSCPLRRFIHNPEKLLAPYITEGMTVLDVGCAMGYFSIPLARMVGETGKVIAADVQEKMIKTLKKRSQKAGVVGRIDARVCPPDSLGISDLSGMIDAALAFAVVHEVPDKNNLFREINQSLKPDGIVLLAEPPAHVPKNEWEDTLNAAVKSGFTVSGHPKMKKMYYVVLKKTT